MSPGDTTVSSVDADVAADRGARDRMALDVGCSFVFDVPAPTHVVLLVEPHTSEVESVLASDLHITQAGVELDSSQYRDSYDNLCRRVTFAPGRAEVRLAAQVEVSGEHDPTVLDAVAIPPHELPAEVLQFVLPSRYCESDQLSDLAWSTFGSIPRGWAQVQAISDWVHGRLGFCYGSASPSHSALTVLDRGEGVCRDYTHLMLALCRALNLPARYVFGYLPDIGVPDPGVPMDFCAWTEIYLDGGWYTFDPRNNQRRIGRVVIGRGRDAADVAMVTSFGPMALVEMTVVAQPATDAAR